MTFGPRLVRPQSGGRRAGRGDVDLTFFPAAVGNGKSGTTLKSPSLGAILSIPATNLVTRDAYLCDLHDCYDCYGASGSFAASYHAFRHRSFVSKGTQFPDRARVLDIAHLMRRGWFRPVHYKTDACYQMRLLLPQRRNLKRMILDLKKTVRRSLKVFDIGFGTVVWGGLARAVLAAVPDDAMTPGLIQSMFAVQGARHRCAAPAQSARARICAIVFAEEGVKQSDLRQTIPGLMAQMEADLNTRLDWITVDHHTTGHPDSHILLR